jgi:hypothetical protein
MGGDYELIIMLDNQSALCGAPCGMIASGLDARCRAALAAQSALLSPGAADVAHMEC